MAQVSVGAVGLAGIAAAPDAVAGRPEVENDIAAAAGVAGPDAMSVAVEVGVVAAAQVCIAAAQVEAAELVAVQDEFGAARDAAAVWDGFRVEPVELVELAGGCWVRLDGPTAGLVGSVDVHWVGRGARFRRGVCRVDRVEPQAGRAGRIRLGEWRAPLGGLLGWDGLSRAERRWDAAPRPWRDGPYLRCITARGSGRLCAASEPAWT